MDGLWKMAAIVFVGGGLGSVTRLLVNLGARSFFPALQFPLATLLVNGVGCLVAGLLAGLLAGSQRSEGLTLFLIVGFLGGFTTFSAFGLDLVGLYETHSLVRATYYLTATVLISVLGVFFGWNLSRMLINQ